MLKLYIAEIMKGTLESVDWPIIVPLPIPRFKKSSSPEVFKMNVNDLNIIELSFDVILIAKLS